MGVKSSLKKYGIGSAIFLIVFLFSFLMLRPIYFRITDSLEHEKNLLLTYLEENLGIRISYESLSPSLLSGIRLRNLTVIDVFSNEIVVQLNSFYIQYNLPQIIRGDVLDSIEAIILDGGIFRYNENKNALLKEKIIAFVEKYKTDAKLTQDLENLQAGSKKKVVVKIPPVIQLKNYNFYYINSTFETQFELRSALLQAQGFDGGTQFFVEGYTKSNLASKNLSTFSKVQANLVISGNISSDFQMSSTQIRFDEVETESFAIKRIAFLLSHNQNDFALRSIKNLYPYNLTAYFNTATTEGSLRLDVQKFDPFSLISTKKSSDALNKIRGSLLTGKYEFRCNITENVFSYTAQGNILASQKILGVPLATHFNIYGNEKLLTVKQLNIESELLNAYFQGDFNLKTLQPQGFAEIQSLYLPNGNILQAEIYIDKLAKGFMVFIPQVFFENHSITALQASFMPGEKSFDFYFEAFDFSHYEYDVPGKISLEGSLLLDEKPYIQSSLSLENFFVDTLLKSLAFFLPQKDQNKLMQTAEFAKTYIVSNDIYVSTDFSDFLLNATTGLITNTVRDREYAIFSLSGNGSSFTLSQFEMLFANQLFFASGELFIGDNFSDVNFSSTIVANSVPYNIYATYIPNETFSLYGDYGFTASVDLRNEYQKDGTIRMTNFPIPSKKSIFGISTNIYFSYSDFSPLSVTIGNFNFAEITETLALKPRFNFQGNLTGNQLYLQGISYSDAVSSLTGSCTVDWELTPDFFQSAKLQLNMADIFNKEKLAITATAQNIKNTSSDSFNFMNDLEISANTTIQSFTFSRFLENQKEEDSISATIFAQGTLANPTISVDITRGLLSLNGQSLDFDGSFSYKEKIVSVQNVNVAYIQQKIENLSANFSIDDFATNITANYYGVLGADYVKTPIQIIVATKLKNPTGGIIQQKNWFSRFDFFNIDVIISELTGSFFTPMMPITFSIRRTIGKFEVSGGYNLSIAGYYLDSGELSLTLKDPLPLKFTATGTIQNNIFDISINDLYADLSAFRKVLTYPFIAVNTALLSGNLHIGGLFSDPEFNGEIFGTQVSLAIPDFIGENLVNNNLHAVFQQNELRVDEAIFNSRRGNVSLLLSLLFDRWMFDVLDLKIKTLGNNKVIAKYKMPMFEIMGDGQCELQIRVQPALVSVVGNIYIENAEGVVSTQGGNDNVLQPKGAGAVEIDLNIMIGTKVQMYFPSKKNPLIRGLVEPQTPLVIRYDSTSGDFDFKGDLNLRGGEILYVKRNFYLKEGRIVFNATQDSFDPIVTLRAEIKERDLNNRPITIILSAVNQPLSELNIGSGAQFSSIPAKNEYEIMKMLGQVFFADSTVENQWGDVLSSIADYGVQVALFRSVETQLRNWFNLDIFSLRLPLVQNTMMQILNQNMTTNQMTFGNFFNNSTVYIGKYFGDFVYVDASVLLNFDDAQLTPSARSNSMGVNFQPSIGLELGSPFGNIKWSLSPEINAKLKSIVQYSSISISWKFVL